MKSYKREKTENLIDQAENRIDLGRKGHRRFIDWQIENKNRFRVGSKSVSIEENAEKKLSNQENDNFKIEIQTEVEIRSHAVSFKIKVADKRGLQNKTN